MTILSKKLSGFIMTMALLISMACMLSISFDAEARRMGGGMSFGRQSSSVMKNSPAAQKAPLGMNRSAQTKAPGATPPRSGMSRFLGPLAGIAAGLGIAALLSGLGIGGAMLEFLSSAILVGVAIFMIMFVIRRLRGNQQTRMTMSNAGSFNHSQRPIDSSNQMFKSQSSKPQTNQNSSYNQAEIAGTNSVAPNQTWFIPEGFDVNAFLQTAKQQFILIQSIWDQGDIEKLKEYMTDDLTREINSQITERAGQQETKVVLLNAELLGIEQVADGHLASVRFSGMLSEEADTAANRFEEVWNLYKTEGSGWLLAGIQQIPVESQS